MDLIKIQEKWQKKWEEAKIFEANPDPNKPKFFSNFPYPYINAYMHIGHLYTDLRAEVFARYKRARGYNVLFPVAWHATGAPIVNAAERVKRREEKQIKIMKDMGFTEGQLKKFEDPKYWVEFFVPEFIKDYRMMGLSVDWRRHFHTTDLNPHYDKFIRWQFKKLKEKGYVIKGKFPVVWDPVQKCPVMDHDRVEGEGEVPQEFLLVKHRLDDGRFLVSATLRPDTILGITNLYVHPKIEYVEAEVGREVWILGEPSAKRLESQNFDIKIKKKIKGSDFIGKRTEEVSGEKVLILPATFLKADFGTGLVHSVPSDSADDLIALWDLQKDEETCKKYGLGIAEVKAIKPIPVLNTPDYGNVPAEVMLKRYDVKSQNERGKLDKIKKEMYKLSHYTATLNEKYKSAFSKNVAGKKVEEVKDFLKQELVKKGWAAVYYELTGKVVSRGLHECTVKIVSDQWFLDYGNEGWKALSHNCLGKMKIYPEKARQQFDYVIDWLHEWACTRETGLGTRLPWDEKWLIESLSDSTIYMAYYTIAHMIKGISPEKIDDNFFDYVLLGEGKKPAVEKADEMRKEFGYWYPVDFRNSGKDLIQNHLTFFIFNHAAIFPEKHWPKGIGVNGWVTVDGKKMSKSLGNMIPVREMASVYSADSSRVTILNGGESLDDPNWDTGFAKSMSQKLLQFHEVCTSSYGKGRGDMTYADKWMESELNKTIKQTTRFMEETLFRSAIQKCFFNLNRIVKWYLKRTNNNPNRDIMNRTIESQLVMLSQFAPHICEEIWSKIGKKGFISLASWPAYDESKIDERASYLEEVMERTLSDINSVLDLVKITNPKKIKLFVANRWKSDLFRKLKEIMENTRDPREILSELRNTSLGHMDEIQKIVPKLARSSIPDIIPTPEEEMEALKHASDFLKNEFKCSIEIYSADESDEKKAAQALPGKVAIIIE